MIASAVAGIGASICCVGPLILLGLGISGAWIANLSALEAVRPFFLLLTVFFIGLAFHKLYLIPQSCEPGKACARNQALGRQRVLFWIVTIPLLAEYATEPGKA